MLNYIEASLYKLSNEFYHIFEVVEKKMIFKSNLVIIIFYIIITLANSLEKYIWLVSVLLQLTQLWKKLYWYLSLF
jgi:hypothetical protein